MRSSRWGSGDLAGSVSQAGHDGERVTGVCPAAKPSIEACAVSRRTRFGRQFPREKPAVALAASSVVRSCAFASDDGAEAYEAGAEHGKRRGLGRRSRCGREASVRIQLPVTSEHPVTARGVAP